MLKTKKLWVALGVVLALSVLFAMHSEKACAGQISAKYRVLAPISSGNLTIYPVVSGFDFDTRAFMSLDEGLRSGDVVVTEMGRIQPLVRRPGRHPITQRSGDQVNQLVLVNNSSRPLLLLAGEIVTGGKQDRVIGKDRIVPGHSDPIDLGVFCVEPGRWVAKSETFGTLHAQMAQPSVRAKAMGDKDQQQVWNEVAKSRAAVGGAVALSSPSAAAELGRTSSYAMTYDNAEVKQRVDEVARPIERSYQSVIRELRAEHAVGVVVAVNGELVWADIFASTELLEKYWPKLVRSYAAEAFSSRGQGKVLSMSAAQTFLDELGGTREMVETEPGLFRHSEINGDGYKVFELTSLLPKTGFEVHIAKMAE